MPHTAYSIHCVSLKYVQFQSLLFYSELNKVHGSYIWILKLLDLHKFFFNLKTY